ncbi:uncharacterized protein Osi17 isoform X1 [Euwallacea fornicatus]|uniref:uncharacterized protein Osi17 isoform X1 n=1 Tax=Euwallacea fornicatus TaxID=995702 RepID=UPI003390098D
MCRLFYLLLFACFSNFVYGSENATFTTELPVDALVNLTGNNDLWTILLKDCKNASLTCVQNNIFKYLKRTLDDTDDLQFNSFLKFTKNKLHYGLATEDRSFNFNPNETSQDGIDEEFPIEAMARTLQDNAAKFLMTHDLEVGLPEGIIPNSVLKIAPQGYGNSGALVNLEIISKDLEEARAMEEGGRTFKKIRKFINERIIYAVLALLVVLKLLAFKFLFLLPLIVGAATAKKLLLKILLFVFPFLHHIFKFCAYYPIQAKYHHHKHLISHIHQVAPHHHDHHDSYGPPIEHHGTPIGHHDTHYTEFDDDIGVVPDDAAGFPHDFHWLATAKNFAVKFARFAVSAFRKLTHFLIANPWVVRVIKNLLKKSLHWSVFVVPQVIKMAVRHPWIRFYGKQFSEKLLLMLMTNFPGLVQMSAAEFISHRRDPTYHNEVPGSSTHPKRPLTSLDVERMLAKAEKEAMIKARLEKERLRIRDENLKLQAQLNQEVKLHEKLKQQAGYLTNKRVPPQKTLGSFSRAPLRGSPFDPGAPGDPGIELPAGYIPQHSVPQRPANLPPPPPPVEEQPYQVAQQNHFDQQHQPSVKQPYQYDQPFQPNRQHQQISAAQGPVYKPPGEGQEGKKTPLDIQKSVGYDPRLGSFENSKDVGDVKENAEVIRPAEAGPSKAEADKKRGKLEQEIDPFYSPILAKIDKILQGLGFVDEPCKERLICSMYKNPPLFSPYSNLLSVELSRDASELQIPTKTNAVVIRFYKYVQAARDGQDQRDCLRLYPACGINTEAS